MVATLRLILMKWSCSIIEMMVFFPLALLAAIYLVPPDQFYLWLAGLPISYLLGVCTRIFIQRRLFYLVVDLLITGSIVLSLYGWNFVGVVSLIIAFCLFYRGILLVEMPWKELFPVGLYWVGTIIYLFCSLLVGVLSAVEPYKPLLTGSGILCVVLTLYATNYYNLQSAALSGSKKPVLSRSLLWHNRVYVILLLLLGYGAANISRIKELLDWLSRLFFYMFIAVFNLLFLIPPPQAPQSHPLVHQSLSTPKQTGGHLSTLPLKFVYVLLAIAGILLLRILLPKLILLIKKIIRWLIQFFAGILQRYVRFDYHTGYEDESERLVPKAFWKLRKLDQLKDWLMMKLRSEPRFSDLTTNRQRIRYLYRQLVLRSMLAGYSYKQFLTPKETGEDLSRWGQQAQRNKPLIDLYNQARYSEKPISDEQMESVHKDPNLPGDK